MREGDLYLRAEYFLLSGPRLSPEKEIPSMVRNLRCRCLFVSVLAFLFALRTTRVSAQGVQKAPRIIFAGNNDTSPPFREMPVGREDRAKPLAHRRPGRPHVDGHPDVVLQSSTEPQVSTTNGLNFGGIGSTGFAPPDANASVGATQVVETVNLSYQVFDKSTGASIFGPFPSAIFGPGMAGCVRRATSAILWCCMTKRPGVG